MLVTATCEPPSCPAMLPQEFSPAITCSLPERVSAGAPQAASRMDKNMTASRVLIIRVILYWVSYRTCYRARKGGFAIRTLHKRRNRVLSWGSDRNSWERRCRVYFGGGGLLI